MKREGVIGSSTEVSAGLGCTMLGDVCKGFELMGCHQVGLLLVALQGTAVTTAHVLGDAQLCAITEVLFRMEKFSRHSFPSSIASLILIAGASRYFLKVELAWMKRFAKLRISQDLSLILL